MKCPKCHYLSFEPEVRCRNCGYDLDLADADLSLKPDQAVEGPLVDLTLHGDVEVAEPARPGASRGPGVAAAGAGDDPDDDLAADDPPDDDDEDDDDDAEDDDEIGEVEDDADDELDDDVDEDEEDAEDDEASDIEAHEDARRAGRRTDSAPAPPLRVVTPAPGQRGRPAEPPLEARGPARPSRPTRAPSTTAELPLFVRNRPETADLEGALIDRPGSPSAPLAVRRRQENARHRARPIVSGLDPQLGPFERDLLQDLRRLEQRVAERARAETGPTVASAGGGVAMGRRLTAAAIDLALLGGISAFVVWATLRLCDLTVQQASTLPAIPLFAFLLVVAAGYLVMFTVAGGQTVGKMLTHIRVVSGDDDEDPTMTPRQAAARALLTLPSVLALGAGFIPALLGQGPAVHDRLSHTRVVRA
jgi:uncharacterized RDD family membrane protein YckC